MHFVQFEELHLQMNEWIGVMNEKGEINYGFYKGGYARGNDSFMFANGSNGKTEKRLISQMQRVFRPD